MDVTVKDVARLAGVSIATVSHVVNRTRYVSPELIRRVEDAMRETGYRNKLAGREAAYRTGRLSEIAFVVPTIENSVYSQFATALSRRFAEHGFLLSIYLTYEDLKRERRILAGLMANKAVTGVVLAPVSDAPAVYAKLLASKIPVVCLERSLCGAEVDCVVSESRQAVRQGAGHLIKCGHERIALLLENRSLSGDDERLEGYRDALSEHGIAFRRELVARLDLYDGREAEDAIRDLWSSETPTAFLAGGNRLTLSLVKALDNLALECPKDVSVVGYGDEEWCRFTAPPLTVIKVDAEAVGAATAGRLLEKIADTASPARVERIPARLIVRNSTQMIARGPTGEKAYPPEALTFSEKERDRLRAGNYKVGISFHYSGTAWKRLHENGIRDTFEKFGVKVVAVMEAHFDPHLQLTQLESLRMQRPDAIIAIPTDDRITAKKFKDIAGETKLVFLSTVPEGFGKADYAGCVTVNERENGRNAGILLGEWFKDRPNAKVGFLTHGAPFHGTLLRDMAAEQVVRENFPDLDIVDSRPFRDIERAYDVCRRMIEAHPELEGLYVSWDRPALRAIRALKEAGRGDVAVITFDLDVEIASHLARGDMVRGLSTQRPYEQGVAVAQVTAKALLGDLRYKYINVQPYVVQPKNLLRAWRDIVHEPPPPILESILQ